MSYELIKREPILEFLSQNTSGNDWLLNQYNADWIYCLVASQPTIDAVPVVRCKDCVYFHKAHVLCNDGTEKDFSEFPPEAFGLLGDSVTVEYGINVGSKCEIDKHNGYGVDKSVFRNEEDFCSRGIRRTEGR